MTAGQDLKLRVEQIRERPSNSIHTQEWIAIPPKHQGWNRPSLQLLHNRYRVLGVQALRHADQAFAAVLPLVGSHHLSDYVFGNSSRGPLPADAANEQLEESGCCRWIERANTLHHLHPPLVAVDA